MTRVALAAAKINLALVVGPARGDGMHPVTSVMQRIGLHDRVELEPAAATVVTGFPGDTLVRAALDRLARETGEGAWRVRLTKTIPVSSGLGGGSADAAAALALANETLSSPLPAARLHEVAAELGADVPFFLTSGPQLAEGVGDVLSALELPQGYWVLVALPPGATKRSTGEVYARFDELGGGDGYEGRRAQVLEAVSACRRERDLALLPPNDLAQAAGAGEFPALLSALGAFRADVSGAGPAVYGLFEIRSAAEVAGRRLPAGTRRWIVPPVW